MTLTPDWVRFLILRTWSGDVKRSNRIQNETPVSENTAGVKLTFCYSHELMGCVVVPTATTHGQIRGSDSSLRLLETSSSDCEYELPAQSRIAMVQVEVESVKVSQAHVEPRSWCDGMLSIENMRPFCTSGYTIGDPCSSFGLQYILH